MAKLAAGVGPRIYGASACVHKGHGPAARAREKARSFIIQTKQFRCILVSSQCFVLLIISVRKGCVACKRQPRTWIQVKDLSLTDPLSSQTRSDFGSVACCFVVCPDQCPRRILQHNASRCPL